MTEHYRLIRDLLQVTSGSQGRQFLLSSDCLKIWSSGCWSPLAFLCKYQQRWLSPSCPAMCVHAAPSSLRIQGESYLSTGTLSLPPQLEQLTKVLGLMWTKIIH